MKKDINDMTEEQQIKKVRKNPFLIADIENPSEKVQLAAIEKDAYNIKFIKNPTEAAQLAAIRQIVENTPHTIAYSVGFLIKNPCDKIKILIKIKEI